MRETESLEARIKHWIGLLGGIGGLVTTLLGLVTALLGTAGPYPATVAALTALIMAAGLGWWRWPRITATKPVSILVPDPPHPPTPAAPKTSHFFEPFRLKSQVNYEMRPWRRVAEAWGLLAFSIAALGFAGGQMARLRAELSGMYCPLAQSGDLRVIIATFNRPEKTEDPFFEQALLNSMQKKFRNRALVCRYKRILSDYEKAQEIGAQYQAAIVIWGNTNNTQYKVYIEDTALKINGEELDSPPGADYLTLGPNQIPYLVGYVQSEILYMNFETDQAIRELEEALALARDQAWAAEHPDLMAEGEYFLGQLEQLAQPAENQQALNHFAQALTLTPENYPIYLSRGNLYLELEKYPEAIADATRVIENAPELANVAYGLRGEAYQAQGDFQAAVADLTQAQELTRVKDNPYVFYDLSLALLLAGDLPAAQAALTQAQPYLDQPTRDDFILGFENEKTHYPDQSEGLNNLQAFIRAQNP